jgi:hypothetical protein
MRKFIILIVIPCGLAWWFWGRTLEPAKVVHGQLEAISQHDYQKAYNYLSAGTQSRLPIESFQGWDRRTANNYTGEFLSRKIEDNVATFSDHVRTFNKEKMPVTYVLKKEGDRWVIEDFRF